MDLFDQIVSLASGGYGCAQIIMQLGLDAEEEAANPGLMKAMDGLNIGIGGTRDVCGCMTGSACLLGYYAGLGEPRASRAYDLNEMIAEFKDWFDEYNEEYECNHCECLIGEGNCNKPMRCPQMMMDCYAKCIEILEDYDVL